MRRLVVFPFLFTLTACGADGPGTAVFTTWGEPFIEEGIGPDPAGESGFVDGWRLKYDKFLVAFRGITVADGKGQTAATWGGSTLVDNVKPGKKTLVTFPDLEAAHWDRVSYQIRPPDAATTLIGASEGERARMAAAGESVYVEGTATKGDIKKTFHWGFPLATAYRDCQQAEESGTGRLGIVVTSGGIDVSELTTHGDHLYYDRLKSSPDPAVKTALRFDEKAAADRDGDGEITLAELDATPIDVRKYDPSGFKAPNLGAFVRALARTIGHFRGEGECTTMPLP